MSYKDLQNKEKIFLERALRLANEVPIDNWKINGRRLLQARLTAANNARIEIDAVGTVEASLQDLYDMPREIEAREISVLNLVLCGHYGFRLGEPNRRELAEIIARVLNHLKETEYSKRLDIVEGDIEALTTAISSSRQNDRNKE